MNWSTAGCPSPTAAELSVSRFPVGIDDVKPVAVQLIAGLDPEYGRFLLAKVDGVLAGWLSLSRYRDPVVPHWGMVKRVQTLPAFRGQGIGRALMDRVREVARDELGLEQLPLDPDYLGLRVRAAASRSAERDRAADRHCGQARAPG